MNNTRQVQLLRYVEKTTIRYRFETTREERIARHFGLETVRIVTNELADMYTSRMTSCQC